MNTISRKMKIDEIDGKYVATVTLDVTIEDNASYYIIDEVYPEGWTVTDASDHGSYNHDEGHIKWVVIQGVYSKEYTYTIECADPLEISSFHGLYMFEGDHTEHPILGKAVLTIAENKIEQIKAYERVADDAVRTSFLTNDDARIAINDFVAKSRIVESLVDPTHEQERFSEHDADWARDAAIIACRYITEYGMVAVTAAESAMTAAVTHREVIHAENLIDQSRNLAENAVKSKMNLETEIVRYTAIHFIEKRTLRATIVIQLQKEKEALIEGDIKAKELATAKKDAALARLIELYNE